MSRVPPVHPGEMLRLDYLAEMGISAYRLAKDLGVSRTTVSGLLNGKRSMSPKMAALLGRYFGTTAEFWLGLQLHYDSRVAAESPEIRSAVQRVRPLELA